MRTKVLLIVVTASAACASRIVPPGPAAVRRPTRIAASYDKTWEAVITYFADRNIPIRTIEKASGIIVAEPARANLENRVPILDRKGKVRYDIAGRPMQSPPVYADCGSENGYGYDPTSAIYNIRVLGDSARSSVQVNVRYLSASLPSGQQRPTIDCSSTGRWEEEIQTFIKERTENATAG